MESGTLELLRCLQSGPFDESNWKHIRSTLRGQRRYLRAQHDLSTLADLVQLLETWAQSSDDPRLGADALREAADIAERELSQPDRAADLRKRALAHSHGGGERARTSSNIPGNPHIALGQRLADSGDIDGAIDAYERALNVEADMDVVYKLAELYAQRSAPGDAEQAADLYCTLGDVLGNPAGMPMVQRALEQVPDHAEALALFQQYGGNAAFAPPANARARVATARMAQEPEPIQRPSAPTHRIASRTVAGIGAPGPVVPSPASTASAPRLAPAVANRPVLKSTGAIGSRGRIQSAARAQGLVAPEPRGGLASDVATNFDAMQSQPTTEEHERPAEDATPRNHATNDNAFDTEPGETDDIDQQAASDFVRAKGPPPLKSAKQRARELQPMPQNAPVITIMQQPSGASLGPSRAVSSLSPVVVEEERALDRLRQSRIRKRKLVGGIVTATALAAAAVVALVPAAREQLSQNLLNREEPKTLPSPPATAAQPASEPEPAPVPEPVAAPSGTTTGSDQAATAAAPSGEPTPATTPTEAKAKETQADAPAKPAPSVLAQLDQANLRGGRLTDAQLTTAFERAGPKLDKCYADALEKRPRLKGRLIVAWTVRPNGKVVSAKKQGGTIKDAELIRCTLDAISSTRFPKPKRQAAQVRMPLEYKRS